MKAEPLLRTLRRLRAFSLGALAVALAACGNPKPPPPPQETLLGWWVGPMLATTWVSRKPWGADDPRSVPTYCSLEFEFLEDGTVETNWLDEDSWTSMCSYAHLPYKIDPANPAVIRIGFPSKIVRSCRMRHLQGQLVAACANGATPPADETNRILLHPREPETRVGLDGLVGSWQSAIGGDLRTLTVRSDARFLAKGVDAGTSDNGWVSATDRTFELHGARNLECAYRATSRKLTIHCRDEDAAQGSGGAARQPFVVYTRTR